MNGIRSCAKRSALFGVVGDWPLLSSGGEREDSEFDRRWVYQDLGIFMQVNGAEGRGMEAATAVRMDALIESGGVIVATNLMIDITWTVGEFRDSWSR